MKESIITKNKNNKLHGYIIHYRDNSLNVRGNFKNGFVINYCEYHFFSKRTEYHIR